MPARPNVTLFDSAERLRKPQGAFWFGGAVKEVKSSLLFVRSNNGQQAWLDKRDIIPLAQAVPYYSSLILCDPQNAWAYAERGIAQANNGNWNNALADLDNAIVLAPKDPRWLYMRAIIHNGRKEFLAAIQDCDKALILDSHLVDAYCVRGDAFASLGQSVLAINNYTSAIDIAPGWIGAYYGRGLANLNRDNNSEASADLSHAIDLGLVSADVFHSLGSAYFGLKDYPKAIEKLSKAIALEPHNGDHYLSRGVVFFTVKEFSKAMTDYDQSIRFTPCPRAFLMRAWLQLSSTDPKCRNDQKALEDAERACRETGWRIPDYLACLAAAYASNGRYDRAIQWQEKALENRRYREVHGQKGTEALDLYKQGKPYRE